MEDVRNLRHGSQNLKENKEAKKEYRTLMTFHGRAGGENRTGKSWEPSCQIEDRLW